MGGLDILQQEQVDLGYAHGLTKQQVHIYARKKYNFLKMEEIRLCLEEGIDTKDVKRMIGHSHSVQDMQRYHKEIVSGHVMWSITLRQIFMGMIVGLSIAFFIVSQLPKDTTVLELKEEQVVLQQGDVFDAMSYVENYTSDAGVLVLPSNINTQRIGDQIAVYVLKSGKKEITKILQVKIVS